MRKCWIFLILLCGMSSVYAEETLPVQLSLVNPVQVVDEENSICGLRMNLFYGDNENVSGVDLGLMNKTDGDLKALALGVVNFTGVVNFVAILLLLI